MIATATKPKSATKWKREADGSYTFEQFKIEKNPAKWSNRYPWILTHPEISRNDNDPAYHFATLADAKLGGPRYLDEQRSKIRTGIHLGRCERAAELVKRCRIKDAKEYSVAMGISYFTYLELKMGVTAAEIATASAKAEAEEFVANIDGPLDLIAAEMMQHIDPDRFQDAPEDTHIIRSGQVTFIVDELPAKDKIDDRYRVTIVYGFKSYSREVSADTVLSAALEGLDKIGTTAMEQLVTEKLLQLTGTEDYMRAGMDKPWGTHHNFLLTDSDGATLEGCLTHTPYTSPAWS